MRRQETRGPPRVYWFIKDAGGHALERGSVAGAEKLDLDALRTRVLCGERFESICQAAGACVNRATTNSHVAEDASQRAPLVCFGGLVKATH